MMAVALTMALVICAFLTAPAICWVGDQARAALTRRASRRADVRLARCRPLPDKLGVRG